MLACLDWLLLEAQRARTVSSRHSSPLELLDLLDLTRVDPVRDLTRVDLTLDLDLDLATPPGSTARLARVSRWFVALLIYLGIHLEAALVEAALVEAALEVTLEAAMVLTLLTLPQLPLSMK
jgi:hypothetical protein